MAPLVLEGETLGQKQHNFNKLVEAALSDETNALLPLDYDSPDIDNLLRIDVACRRRNVDYVLHVLQSDDMLYVSRAIKQSTWLISDDQYAHIINPRHLHDELFPKMMGKAKNKLLSAIRLNLKSETRVDEFFKYYESDLKIAQKWLPFCSIALIEKVYHDSAEDITVKIFKRLCERTINVLKLYIKYKLNNYDREYNATEELKASKFLLNKYPEDYLQILKSYVKKIPNFGGRATRYMMQHAREIVVNNFEIFNYHIHIPTFVKCLKKEDVPGFLMTLAEGKLKHFIRYHHVKNFVKKLPMATFALKLQFLNMLFKTGIDPNPGLVGSVNPKMYRWYTIAPFDTAFTDLKKLIREESSPEDRANMLKILVCCARRDPLQLQTLVRYYREKHMNEPFKFKVQFIDALLSSVVTHRFDEEAWRILDDIFTSMEVYIQSNDNPLNNCIKAIIVYKLLHNEAIPEIIKSKQSFDTFKDYRKKLEGKERNVLFKYLYSLEMNKLHIQTAIKNETEMLKVMENLDNVFLLLKDWEMKLSDFPEVLNIVRNIIKSKKDHSIEFSLVSIYNVEKKWRKDLFEDSLALQNNDAACIHALKHDPTFLLSDSAEVAAMCCNDTISLKNTLSKLRIYWAQSLAQEWAEQYMGALEKPKGHKATVEGICILFPRKQFINILTKYAPTKTRIDWSNSDTITLSVQKNIAKRMMLVRPSLKLDAILLYAKDDYLQFTLPSLNAIIYNMSATQVSEYIPILFNWPVSLKKHGVRLAYSKLNFSAIKYLVEHTWRNSKNSSIKRLLFKETFKLLKIEKKHSAIIDLWEVQSMFIENLTPDENKLIYNTLVNDEYVKLPLLVRPKFFMKAYKYLKSIRANVDCENILSNRHTYEITNLLEPNFVEQVMIKPVDELVIIVTENSSNTSEFSVNIPLMIAYIANSENEKSQYAKYEKYLIPILDACFKSWKTYKNGEYIVMKNCFNLLKRLVDIIESSITNKYVLNVKVFKDIETRYRTALPLEENYRHLTFWTIATLFVESYNSYMMEPVDLIGESGDIELSDVRTDREKEKRHAIHTAVAPLFGKSCSNFIKQDISSKLPSLADFFATSLSDVFDCLGFAVITRLQTLRNMLDSEVPVSYLVALEATCFLYCDDEKSIKLRQELYRTIKWHPSEEVKILYHAYAERNEIEV